MMESRDGMSTVTSPAPAPAPTPTPAAPSAYHVGVAQRIENPTPVTGTPPVNTALVVSSSSEKKKRGRPRKYGPDGTHARPLSPTPLSASAPPSTGQFLVEKGNVPRVITSEKKQKQRMGTEKLGDWVSCATGGNFLPHMITVHAGEDVAMKIISFAQQGPRAICIISGVGLISNVTLRHPNSSGGTLTYEGRFEILSLSGSFTPTEIEGGSRSRTGGMSITLASPDGRVVGGLLAGLLVAATPVQVVVGSFMPSNYAQVKPKKQNPEMKLITNATTSFAENGAPPSTSTPTPTPLPTMNQNRELRKPTTDINISLQRE